MPIPGQGGSVTLSFDVQPDGKTSHIRVVESNPPGVLDAVATKKLADTTFASSSAGFGNCQRTLTYEEWPVTVTCPEGRVYRDVRRDAGREEFCELHLPGGLVVRDGPARWWFSQGHFGEEGRYENGRKMGTWKECDRFDRCKTQTYGPLWPQEAEDHIEARIPVLFKNNKYVFDFGACWSTWVSVRGAGAFDLNIGHRQDKCSIAHLPTTENGEELTGRQEYVCDVPRAVGVREFDSLDLEKEFPATGLPQFCWTASNTGMGMPYAIVGHAHYLPGEPKVRYVLADPSDVECASLGRTPDGAETLTLRLNQYAEPKVLARQGELEFEGGTCGLRYTLPTMHIESTKDGHTLFVFGLSKKQKTREQQRACIQEGHLTQGSCGQ